LLKVGDQLGGWLDDLASASPAPGGGAAAALSAAMGASLLCMVCNLTIGKPRYAAYEGRMVAVLESAEEKRRAALTLAEDDARAFEAVIAAYRLPRQSDAEIQERKLAIQQSTIEAAVVSLRTAQLGVDIICLADDSLQGANLNVISDVAAGVLMARAAVETSAVNVEINLSSIAETERGIGIGVDIERCREALLQADSVVAAVRKRIAE